MSFGPVFTPANLLTLMRVMLIPAFVILMIYGYRGWALVMFAAAGFTDLFDGLVARATGERTTLGAWLDPMADKLLIVTMFVILTLPGVGAPNRLPIWFTVLVISRDIAIVGTVAVFNLAIGPRTFRPSMSGKIATALYIVTGVTALYFNYRGEPSTLVRALIWASLAITFISAADYAVRVARMGH